MCVVRACVCMCVRMCVCECGRGERGRRIMGRGGYTDWIRSVICARNRAPGASVERSRRRRSGGGGGGGWRVMVVDGLSDSGE